MFRQSHELGEPSVAAVTDSFAFTAPVLTPVGAAVATPTGLGEDADHRVSGRQPSDIAAGLLHHA
jgi:hypothetical protein